MKKRQVRYPATVAFRTTEEIKEQLAIKALDENKTVSEVLKSIVKKGLHSDFLTIYSFLVTWLASIRNKDPEWIKKRIDRHYKFLRDDAHHGYSEKTAMADIKEEIEICLELAKQKKMK